MCVPWPDLLSISNSSVENREQDVMMILSSTNGESTALFYGNNVSLCCRDFWVVLGNTDDEDLSADPTTNWWTHFVFRNGGRMRFHWIKLAYPTQRPPIIPKLSKLSSDLGLVSPELWAAYRLQEHNGMTWDV